MNVLEIKWTRACVKYGMTSMSNGKRRSIANDNQSKIIGRSRGEQGSLVCFDVSRNAESVYHPLELVRDRL